MRTRGEIMFVFIVAFGLLANVLIKLCEAYCSNGPGTDYSRSRPCHATSSYMRHQDKTIRHHRSYPGRCCAVRKTKGSKNRGRGGNSVPRKAAVFPGSERGENEKRRPNLMSFRSPWTRLMRWLLYNVWCSANEQKRNRGHI